MYIQVSKKLFHKFRNKIGVYYLILNNSNYSICLVQKLKSTLWRIGTNTAHILYQNLTLCENTLTFRCVKEMSQGRRLLYAPKRVFYKDFSHNRSINHEEQQSNNPFCGVIGKYLQTL